MNTINNNNFEQNALSFLLTNCEWHYISWTNVFTNDNICSASCLNNWNAQFFQKYTISKSQTSKKKKLQRFPLWSKRNDAVSYCKWHYRKKWGTLLAKNKIISFKLEVNCWIKIVKYCVLLEVSIISTGRFKESLTNN